MRSPKILVFSGSIRRGSWNGHLADLAVKQLALADASPTLISLADYPMPLFDADLESAGKTPEAARQLFAMFQAHHGVLITSPEYNASVTPLLKNTLDWLSRFSDKAGTRKAAFKNRVFSVASAGTGRFGGMRSLLALRTILEAGMGALVIPEQVSVPDAGRAFDEDGGFHDPRLEQAFRDQLQRLAREAHAYIRP